MRTYKQNKLLKSFVTAASLLSSFAAAQASVNVQSFEPADNFTYMKSDDAMPSASNQAGGYRLSATYNFVNEPLVILNADRTSRVGTMIDGLNTLDLLFSAQLNPRLSIGADLPLDLIHLTGQSNNFAMGDSRVFMKYRLTNPSSSTAVAIVPELFTPTGSSDLNTTDGSFGVGAHLVIEHYFGVVRTSFNVGYRYSPQAVLQDLDYRHRVPISLGAYVPVSKRWGVNGEAGGSLLVPFRSYDNPGEVYLGAVYQATNDWALMAGAGTGQINGPNGTDARFALSLRFAPVTDENPIPVPYQPIAANEDKIVKTSASTVVVLQSELQRLNDIRFQFGTAIITENGKTLLNEVAEIIRNHPDQLKHINIEGHTDTVGTRQRNQVLSEQRATSVKKYLVSQGIEDKKLSTAGFGFDMPSAAAKPGMPKVQKMALDRRVEFRVVD